MIAVRNDCGLKNPGSHTDDGRLKSEVHDSNSLILSKRSAYQADNPLREAYANFVQAGGTLISLCSVLSFVVKSLSNVKIDKGAIRQMSKSSGKLFYVLINLYQIGVDFLKMCNFEKLFKQKVYVKFLLHYLIT